MVSLEQTRILRKTLSKELQLIKQPSFIYSLSFKQSGASEYFPTIILLYQNKIHYYNFDINSASLLKFYKKIKNGPIRELENLSKLEIVLKAHIKILLSTIEKEPTNGRNIKHN